LVVLGGGYAAGMVCGVWWVVGGAEVRRVVCGLARACVCARVCVRLMI